MKFLITGLFSKIPSPKIFGKDRFDDLSMLHLTPLTYPTLKLVTENLGIKILHIEKDEKKTDEVVPPHRLGNKVLLSFLVKRKKKRLSSE
jgi:hypothetical protein